MKGEQLENMKNQSTKRWLGFSTVTIAALALGVAPLSASVVQEQGAAGTMDEMTQDQTMTAEILSVDMDSGTITVKELDREINEVLQRDEVAAEESEARGERLILKVDSATEITDNDGMLTNLTSIHPGERVNIRFETLENGKMRAKGVTTSK